MSYADDPAFYARTAEDVNRVRDIYTDLSELPDGESVALTVGALRALLRTVLSLAGVNVP